MFVLVCMFYINKTLDCMFFFVYFLDQMHAEATLFIAVRFGVVTIQGWLLFKGGVYFFGKACR